MRERRHGNVGEQFLLTAQLNVDGAILKRSEAGAEYPTPASPSTLRTEFFWTGDGSIYRLAGRKREREWQQGCNGPFICAFFGSGSAYSVFHLSFSTEPWLSAGIRSCQVKSSAATPGPKSGD